MSTQLTGADREPTESRLRIKREPQVNNPALFVVALAALLMISTLSGCGMFADSPSSTSSGSSSRGTLTITTSDATPQETNPGVDSSGEGARGAPSSRPAVKYPVNLFSYPEHSAAATVKKVVDGDTLIVIYENGREETVRLIGIDTPEKLGGYRPAECFGAESTDFLRSLTPARSQVFLTAGEEPFDIYERRLAYVYRSDGIFVNLMIAREGYADVLSIPPNNDYAAYFSRAVSLARTENLGIWGTCGGADTPLRQSDNESG